MEEVHAGHLFLLVYKPRHSQFLRWFGRWKVADVVHTDGPILYNTPDERLEWVEGMIEAGIAQVPRTARYMTALSLADVKEIVEDTWKPR